MIHRHLCTLGAGSILLAAAATSQATLNSANAFDNGTISTTGPRTNPNNQNYFDVENGAGAYGYFAVADFHVSSFGITKTVAGVSSFALTLTEDNASFSAPGSMEFWLSSDTSASIDYGTSTLKFDKTHLPGGLGSQLNPVVSLGSGSFTTTGEVNMGKADVYTFSSLSSAAETMLVDTLNTPGANLRVVITPNDSAVAATWAGYANTTYAGPKLTLNTTAVPEPASIAALLVGAVALIGKRRRN